MMQPAPDKRGLFDRMQIKTKLVLLIVLTSVVALIDQPAGFIAYERMRVTDQLVSDLSTNLARKSMTDSSFKADSPQGSRWSPRRSS